MARQADGPIGSMARMDVAMGQVKTALGKVVIEGVAPFVTAFANNVVPVLQYAVGGLKSLVDFVKPVAPVFMVAGTAAAALVGGLAILRTASFFSGQIAQATQFGLSLLKSVIPAVVTTTTTETALGAVETSLSLKREALTLATVRSSVASGTHAVAAGIESAALWVGTAAATAFGAALTFAMSPIGIIVISAAALAGAMIYLYNNVTSVRELFNNVWTVIATGASYTWDIIKKVLSVSWEYVKAWFNVITMPAQIVWGVIKGIGGAIASLFGGIGSSASGTSSVLKAMGSAFDWIGDKINIVSSAISAFSAYVSALIDGTVGALVSLLTLDFSGFADKIGGMFGGAADSASKKFIEEMNKKNWEDATKKLEDTLGEAKEINVKVNAGDNFSDLLKKYEETKAKIDELSAKKSEGNITADEQKQLDDLTLKAQAAAQKIGELAPAAKENAKIMVDGAGQMKEVWDVNIAKAQEYATTNNAQSQLADKANDYSTALMKQSDILGDQTVNAKALQEEYNKSNDPKQKEKLFEKLKEEQTLVNENRKALVKSFTEGGAAGLITEEALNKIADRLGMTSEEAKKMLLTEELKKAQEQGILTEAAVARLAEKYGKTPAQIKEAATAQAQQTKEVEKTTQEVKNLSEAYGSVKKSIDAAFDASKNEYVFAASMKKLYTSNREQYNKIYAGLSDDQKKFADAAVSMTNDELKAKERAAKDNYETKKAYAKATGDYEKEYDDKSAKSTEKTGEDNLKKQNEYNESLLKLRQGWVKTDADNEKERNKNSIESLNRQRDDINANEKLSATERTSRLLALDLQISKAREDVGIKAAQERVKTTAQAEEKAMIEALGKTTKEAGKAYVKYNSELTSIQTDETLTTTEKYSKIEALDKKYFTEVLEASKRTNEQKSEDIRLFTEISTRSETQLQEQISNIKTSYVNSNSKTQAKADKEISAESPVFVIGTPGDILESAHKVLFADHPFLRVLICYV